MSELVGFDDAFQALTGHDPFPWQRSLYRRLLEGNIPVSCDIPTGLGKTAVVAVWLIALANRPDKVPRRLVYVVNRRTVVDQTTDEVENMRANLKRAGLLEAPERLCAIPLQDKQPPLAMSTLRGQFADNREWSADPARPAVIVGTVDMIGSRLLFSGYGIGFKGRPLHAGFLGQDVLVVHDEAHLEPAFQKVLVEIRKEQQRCKEFRPLHVMALTATAREEDQRTQESPDQDQRSGLTEQEKSPPAVIPDPPTDPVHHVWRRLKAKKSLRLCKSPPDKMADSIAKLALEYKNSNAAALLTNATRTWEGPGE